MCKWGTTVSTEINGKKVSIDACIFDVVDALNKAGIETIACCCGHGNLTGNIVLKDNRVLELHPVFSDWIEQQNLTNKVNIHGELITA